MNLNALLFISKKLLNSLLSSQEIQELDMQVGNLKNILEKMDETFLEFYGALSGDCLDVQLYFLDFIILD